MLATKVKVKDDCLNGRMGGTSSTYDGHLGVELQDLSLESKPFGRDLRSEETIPYEHHPAPNQTTISNPCYEDLRNASDYHRGREDVYIEVSGVCH